MEILIKIPLLRLCLLCSFVQMQAIKWLQVNQISCLSLAILKLHDTSFDFYKAVKYDDFDIFSSSTNYIQKRLVFENSSLTV